MADPNNEPAQDADALAQLAIRLGLVTPEAVRDAWDELGGRGGDPEPFLKHMERKGYLTPWQSSKLAKGEPDGYFLGGYRIEYKIASGSFGRVYRAGEVATGRIVAVKVLRRKWSEKEKDIDLFEREGKLGMSMKHPNVVEILSVNHDVASRQHYIVMEFVEGGNLRDLLKMRKKLEPGEALRYMDDVTAGLSYAFSRGVTHRDMKLTNVLMSSSGQAKLVDFGLADTRNLMLRGMHDETQVDRTVDYAGLEKCTGVPPGDVRTDIYFMGCVLYELLTGRSPLPMTKDPKERMKRERFVNVQPMEKSEVNGPPSLFRLVENMMSLSPELRFQTPSQLLEAIREVRRELEGKTSPGKAAAPKSLFIVEKDERLQDALRDGFKAQGFRVFLASDPARSLDRYRQQPFDALIVDAGTVGEDGMFIFDKVMSEAKRHHRPCCGILVFSENQRDWIDRVESRHRASLLVRPVTLRQLQQELGELLAIEDEPEST